LNIQNSGTFPGPGLLGALHYVGCNHVHLNRKNNLPFFLNQIIFKKMHFYVADGFMPFCFHHELYTHPPVGFFVRLFFYAHVSGSSKPL
jgi:hypothetical protein